MYLRLYLSVVETVSQKESQDERHQRRLLLAYAESNDVEGMRRHFQVGLRSSRGKVDTASVIDVGTVPTSIRCSRTQRARINAEQYLLFLIRGYLKRYVFYSTPKFKMIYSTQN